MCVLPEISVNAKLLIPDLHDDVKYTWQLFRFNETKKLRLSCKVMQHLHFPVQDMLEMKTIYALMTSTLSNFYTSFENNHLCTNN